MQDLYAGFHNVKNYLPGGIGSGVDAAEAPELLLPLPLL